MSIVIALTREDGKVELGADTQVTTCGQRLPMAELKLGSMSGPVPLIFGFVGSSFVASYVTQIGLNLIQAICDFFNKDEYKHVENTQEKMDLILMLLAKTKFPEFKEMDNFSALYVVNIDGVDRILEFNSYEGYTWCIKYASIGSGNTTANATIVAFQFAKDKYPLLNLDFGLKDILEVVSTVSIHCSIEKGYDILTLA